MSIPKVLVVARDAQEREQIGRAFLRAEIDALIVGDVLGAYWALRGYCASVIALDCRIPRQDRDELRALLSRDPRLKGVCVVTFGAEPAEVRELVARVHGALLGAPELR